MDMGRSGSQSEVNGFPSIRIFDRHRLLVRCVREVFTQSDFAVDSITASPATGHQGQNCPASADGPLARAVKAMVGCPVFSLATPVSFIFTFDHRNFYDPDAVENGAAEEANRVLKRILIVEDNELHFRLLNDLLEVHGYKILKTEYGREAVKLARNNSPDLILMDIKLPDLSGLDVTRLLKQDDQTKRIPIIAVTAFAMPEDERKALESGCDGYVSKPIMIQRFLHTVQRFLSP
jgi:two-component system cell cycle response regulator DivK